MYDERACFSPRSMANNCEAFKPRLDIKVLSAHPSATTIDIFRQQTHDAYLAELEVLASLFNHIDQHDDFDHDEIERTLERWAKSSRDIADVAEAEARNRGNTCKD
jgi:hypothetical protein